MITKLLPLTYGQCRYEFIKELDTPGYIGEKLIMMQPQFAESMMELGTWVDQYIDAIPDPNNMPCRPKLLLFEDNISRFYNIINIIPYMMFANSEYDWTLFLSAFIGFVNTVCNVTIDIINNYHTPDNDDEYRELMQNINDLLESLKPIYLIIEFSLGYSDLIKASAILVDELKGWTQSQPAPLKLSQAYLQAIGFEK